MKISSVFGDKVLVGRCGIYLVSLEIQLWWVNIISNIFGDKALVWVNIKNI